MRLLAALWALQSTAGAPTNGTAALCQDPTAYDADAGAPQNGSAPAPRVAVLLPGEMRCHLFDCDNLMGSLAAFDVFVSTYAEDADRARLLRPTGLLLTPRAELSLASGRMYQWYHLDRLLREFKDALLAYDVLFRTRTDAYFFEPMTPAHFARVGTDTLHMATDHAFYARPATFYRVYEGMFAAVQDTYLRAGGVYFPLDYENLVQAYRLDAVNNAHVRMVKRHPTLAYRFTRINLGPGPVQGLVYPTSIYNKDTEKLIENIERHLRAKLPIDNGRYTNKNRGNKPFFSEKFHLVHALTPPVRARIADFAAPTVGVLWRQRPAAAASGSCPRPPDDDALLRAWRDALADLPEDTSERPMPRTPPQTRPHKRRQDICPRATADDALLQAWRDALAKKSEGVCKNRRGKSTTQLAQETMRQKSARVTLADRRRHADRVAAKAALYARGARIRNSAKGR
jgi:hypothetical protein